MKLTVKPELKIDDGAHTGIITAVDYRSIPHDYVDFTIEFEEGKRMKAGFPLASTVGCLLMNLISSFGYDVSPDKQVEPECLIGKKCKFVTLTSPSKKDPSKKYANILAKSVGPAE